MPHLGGGGWVGGWGVVEHEREQRESEQGGRKNEQINFRDVLQKKRFFKWSVGLHASHSLNSHLSDKSPDPM